jgi:hypothetical protein
MVLYEPHTGFSGARSMAASPVVVMRRPERVEVALGELVAAIITSMTDRAPRRPSSHHHAHDRSH